MFIKVIPSSSIALAGLALLGFGSSTAWADITPQQLEFFENKIRPVLAETCYQCHNSVGKKKGDFALDYEAALLEADIIVPGDPENSPLIQAIKHADGVEPMPDKGPKLANLIVKNFEDWIRMGAPDPRLKKPTKEELDSQVDWSLVRVTREKWWSFQPIRKTTPPRAANLAWDKNAIDRFVFDGLKTHGLEPQKAASPGTLVRRLHLILTGLPPKPDVVAAFVAGPSEEAYSNLVDELMASPAYGERWARYWMDWYRYAESHGSEGDPAIPHVTQYRDYLVRALNGDVAYDQLLREHLAGDLLETPRVNREKGLNESAIGLAHYRLVPHGFGVTDAYDEQITFTDNQVDVISKAMMGITVSCARCHNHKFDPISQEDYYKFYGIMISSRPAIVNVDSPELQNLHKKELLALKKKMRDAFGSHWMTELDDAMGKLEKAKLDKVPETDPLGAWAKLRNLNPGAVKQQIAAMATRHHDGLAQNEKAKKNATFYADLREQSTYDQWFKSGNGLGEKVSPAGSFAVASDGDKTFTGIYPAGVYSHMISDKHSGFLNSVFHLASGERTTVRAMGANAPIRFCVRSYPLSHGGLHPAPVLKPNLGWMNLNKYKIWNGEKGYYQVNTGADFTFRKGSERSWFGLLEVYAGSEKMRELGFPIVALPGDAAKTVSERDSLLEFYRSALKEAIPAWRRGSVTDAQAKLLDSFVSRGFLANDVAGLPGNLKSLVDSYRKLESAIRIPVRAPGVVEGEPWDQPLLERGSYKKELKPVARGFLEMWPGKPYSKQESGRRELAEDMVSEKNTLTTRVIVNRLWHHVFGRGIVASTDNFGRLGKEPSHPELLDHLAADFRENGWSMKRTVRQLVMSRTFRADSIAPDANAGKDEENLQLAHFTPRRLDAEAILDTINFVAANGAPRRAIYRSSKRNSLDRFLSTFNFPIPTSTVGVRNLTNVPAQSLTLMNGEITKNAARQWSNRLRNNPDLKRSQDLINSFFLQAYARSATKDEMESCLSYMSDTVDDGALEELEKERTRLRRLIAAHNELRRGVVAPFARKLQAEVDRRNAEAAKSSGKKPLDLKPIGRWDFEKDAKDAIGGMHGKLMGKASIKDGALVLEGGCLLTSPIKKSLQEKTLEALVQLDPLDQKAGGAMIVQTLDAVVFDGIVYAEVSPNTWLSGSDRHHRTKPFGGPRESAAAKRPVHMVIVYDADGTTTCYRDGKLYGKPHKVEKAVRFEAGKAQVGLGLRHGREPSRNRVLTGKIFEARLYDRALRADEVAAAATGSGFIKKVVTEAMLAAAVGPERWFKVEALDREVAVISTRADEIAKEIENFRKARGASDDPLFRIAHAILNSKELIYVY